jgi:plastocyanin
MLSALFVPAAPLSPVSASTTPAASSAQSDAYRVKLRSREFTPEPGLRAQDRALLNADAAQGDADVHAFVQMYAIPTPEEQAELAERGIHLLTYIPNRTWIAAIPADALNRVLETPGVRWLGAIEVDDKLAPEIRAGAFGDWHYDAETGIIAVVMQLHEDVALDEAEDLILGHGGMVRGYIRSINGVTAEVSAAALQSLAADDRVMWIQAPPPTLTPTNNGARDALNVDVLHPSPYNPIPSYNLDGSGIDVLVYDGGQVDDHDDFGTRLVHGDSAPTSDHATHVAGTVGGDGSRSAAEGGTDWQWRGMAPDVGLISYGVSVGFSGIGLYTNPGDVENDWDEAKNTHGADLGTASLGTNVTPRSALTCAMHGDYAATSVLLDEIVRGSLGEPYIATWANGNERGYNDRCGAQYNTIAPPACAKNPIQVGATNSNDNSMSVFSAWGPCDDGRIKPVIVAPGDENDGWDATPYCSTGCISSTVLLNDYGGKAGTSMATPAAAGVLALMLQQYRETYNRADEFLPSTAKALFMNTATDLGNVGPDYQFGYGHIDAQAAVDAIIDGLFREGTLTATGQQDEYLIQVPSGATTLQVSLAWDDASAAAMASSALVNDLDLTLLDPGGGLHQVWTLDPANPANAATTGTDDTNNQEQVTVNNPQQGVWRVRVNGTTVPDAPQTYSLAATHRLISMEIAKPTQAASADVGLYSDPEKLLIDLDLRDKFTGPLSTTISSATDLQISIGGQSPSSVFPGSNVGNHYWVWVTPPTKSSAGCHDLEVTLFGTLTDMETNAVCYGTTAIAPQDMVLTIDKSGSMSWDDKMDSTKSAAEYFVTAAAIGDMIGAVAFSETANLEFPLTTITGTATKDNVDVAIGGLTAFGTTAMGPGMQMADMQLTMNGGAGHRRTIVLLSDGKENETPYWSNISNTVPTSTTIHTVALGPDGDPDEDLLSSTAAKFNGNYYRVTTGGSSLLQALTLNELSNELANVYRSAAEKTYGWERLWEASGEVGGFCQTEILTHSHRVYVEQGLSEVIFAMHWDSVEIGEPTLTLTRPDGTMVDPGDPDVIEHRRVQSTFDTGHEQYRVSGQDGHWTVTIAGYLDGCSEYIVMAEGRSKNNLDLLSPTPGQHVGFCQDVPLMASFLGSTYPISGAMVMAELVGPLTGGGPQTLQLFDDGEHGDGQADDGMYGNTFVPCPGLMQSGDGVGSYQVRVTANGTTAAGEPITRSVLGAYYATASTTSDPDPELARVLLVDDDDNIPDVRDAYTATLDSLGVTYDIWDIVNDGPVVTPTLTAYHTVIWFTGDDMTDTVEADNEMALAGFLDQGGKLFLSSQHYASEVGTVNTFMTSYLYVSAVLDDVGASTLSGVTGNNLSDGLGPYTLSPVADSADRLTPATPGGQSAFVNEADSTVAVNFADGDSCSLFGAFPFERLASADAEELMDSFLTWPCWDPSIMVAPEQVSAPLWTAGQSRELVNVANPGQGKLTWVVNEGPIHLWAVTDADGEVPTFIDNLQTTPITDDVQLEVCTVTSGIADCCTGATCTQDELLNQDVLVIYNNQSFSGAAGLGDMLADFVDAGGTVILANNAMVDGAGGLGGRFMSADYSPLESTITTSVGAPSLGTYDAGHPLMSGVSSAGALSHLDVVSTSGDIDIIATWDSGEPFVAIKAHAPAPVPGQVIAINAPLEDGQWSGDVDTIVTNAIQWLSDNVRDLPWLDHQCSFTPPLPPEPGLTAIDYTCPPIDSGEDLDMALFLDGSMLMAPVGTMLRGKVFIEHNVSEHGRVNIPVTGTLQTPVDLTSVTISGAITGTAGTYTFTTSYEPISATMPITYMWDNLSGGSTSVRDLSAGVHTLMVTATNVSSMVTDTHTITLTAAPCVPLTGVTLTASSPGEMGTPMTFEADVSPDDASTPYTYTIDYGDGTTPVTGTTGADPLTFDHTYAMTGTFMAEVGVWNCDLTMPITDALTVEIVEDLGRQIYLPIVLRDYTPTLEAEVTMEGSAFKPREITVTVGTTVIWTNQDAFEHTVTSGTRGSPTTLFDASVSAGETFSFTFQSAGTYDYYCKIHTGMDGVVNVEE